MVLVDLVEVVLQDLHLVLFQWGRHGLADMVPAQLVEAAKASPDLDAQSLYF